MAPSRELVRLKPSAPNKRMAATITLLGVLVCAAPLLALPARPAVVPAAHAASNRLAEASPPRVVKRVDAVPAGTPCEQRAWPNFDAKCPGPAGPPVAAMVAPAPLAAATPAPAQSVPAAGAAQAIVQGAALASAPMPMPLPSTTGAPARARDAASGTRNWATWDEGDAPLYEPVKPPPHRAVRQQQFGIFGLRF